MKKTKLRKLISVALSLVMLVSVIVPSTSFFAFAEDNNYPAPVLKSAPELLKEFATPNVSIPTGEFSDNYSPAFSGTVAADAPVIATVTAQAGPNDSITITGTSFAGASVYAYGLVDGVGQIKELAQTLNTADTINAIIDSGFDYTLYIIWVKSASGKMSAPVRVNAPELTWLSNTTVSAGSDISLYGKFLTSENADGEDAKSYIYVTNGSNYYEATLKEANPYKVTVTLPQGLANGSYKLWLHNGHGGDYGWSNSLDFAISAGVENVWTGATRTVQRNSSGETTQSAIDTAISSSNTNDTIILPAGDYYIRKADWYIQKPRRFVGETDANGNPLVRFIFVASQNAVSGQSMKAGSTAIRVRSFPSEFRNIIFMDNIDKTAFTNQSNFNIDYSYCTFMEAMDTTNLSAGNFTVENCQFITRRTPGGEETNGVTYADLEARYTYGNVNDKDASRYSQSTAVSVPLHVSGVKNVHINNNYVRGSLGIDTRNCEYAFVTNNTLEGVWIQRNSHQGGCLRDFSSSKLEISGNFVRGRDYYTDPAGALTINDQTFGRGIVVQTPNKSDTELYIADNDMERIGQSNINAGELILFEDLTTLYIGGLKSVSNGSKTIELNPTASDSWSTSNLTSSGGQYKLNTYNTVIASADNKYVSPNTANPRLIKGQRVIITKGTGIGQWRTITNVTATSITVDRPWDVVPDTTSVLFMAPVCENIVMFRNRIVGSKDFYTNSNSTIGIQAYETMLDTIADRNFFMNVHEGVSLNVHYDERRFPEKTSSGGSVLHENMRSDYGFNVFSQFMVMNNTVNNARYGVNIPALVTTSGQYKEDDTITTAYGDMMLHHGTIIRANRFEQLKYGYDYRIDTINRVYNIIEDDGGVGIAIGKQIPVLIASRAAMTTETFISGIVIEGNEISGAENASILLAYGQENTVLRNNSFGGTGKIEDFLKYTNKPNESYPLNAPIYYYNYGTMADGMSVSAASAEPMSAFTNGNFQQGLKYWASASGKGAAGAEAKVVTDGTNNYIEINSADGIKSVNSSINNVKAGEKYAFVYDKKGSGKAKVSFTGRAVLNSSVSSKELPLGNAISGFTKYITAPVTIATMQDMEKAYINCVVSSNGKSYIDNIELVKVYEDEGIYETLSGDKYYLADGQSFGGTEEDGIVLNAEYPAVCGMQNGDFSQGLKFWLSTDNGVSFPTDKATVQNGIATVTKGNGIMTAPFKLSNDMLSGSASENKAAVIVKYTGSSTYFKAELYINGVYAATSGTGLGNKDTNHIILPISDVTLNANDTYQLKIYPYSTLASIGFDYIGIARYNTTACYTDLSTGKIYNADGEITAPASVGTNVATPSFYNNSFDNDLSYWVKSGTVTASSGTAVLKYGATLQSVYFNPHLEDGDSIAVLCKYKSGNTPKLTVSKNTVSSTGSSSSATLVNKNLSAASSSFKLAATDAFTYQKSSGEQTYLSVTLGAPNAEATFEYVAIVKVETDKNLYTDIITGDRYCIEDLSVYGGTAEEGISAANRNQSAQAAITEIGKKWVTDIAGNLDLSNGLKYFLGINSGSNKTISQLVNVVDNTIVFNLANAASYDGIATAPFKFPSNAVGKQAYLTFDVRISGTNSTTTLLNLRVVKNNAVASGDTGYQSTNNKWVSKVSNPITLTESNINDVYWFAFDLRGKAYASEIAIRNLNVVFMDEGGMGKYYDANGTSIYLRNNNGTMGKYYNIDGSPLGTVYGDANADGVINVLDIVKMVKYLAGAKGATIYKAAANLDKDANIAVTATDLALLKEYILTGEKNF